AGGFFDFRMIGQAQIAVGAQHQDFFILDDDFGVLGRGNVPEIGVYPQSPELGGALELLDLVEERHRTGTGLGFWPNRPMVNGFTVPGRSVGGIRIKPSRTSGLDCRCLILVNHNFMTNKDLSSPPFYPLFNGWQEGNLTVETGVSCTPGKYCLAQAKR